MRKSSVDSATGIDATGIDATGFDNGCVIAFPREKTIGICGSASRASLPEASANPSAVSSLRLDRYRLGMAYQQADSGPDQDVDLRNFAAQNLIVQQMQVGDRQIGHRNVGHRQLGQLSARLPVSSSVVMDHAVAGSQMFPDRQPHSPPAHSSVTASPAGGSDTLRKAAAARLVAVAQGDPGQSGFGQGPMDQNDLCPPSEGAATSSTEDVSSYIAHMTQELAQMARASNLDLLAYFLEMAELEARMRNGSSLQSA